MFFLYFIPPIIERMIGINDIKCLLYYLCWMKMVILADIVPLL